MDNTLQSFGALMYQLKADLAKTAKSAPSAEPAEKRQ